ncbi:MAG: hypothetical protein RIT14_2167 [Pseudomonadota bacterium]|jgi:hypothetical protein
MTDMSVQEQFDLDWLATDLGALPEAPLAMPVQQLEQDPEEGGLLSFLRPRMPRVQKVGH